MRSLIPTYQSIYVSIQSKSSQKYGRREQCVVNDEAVETTESGIVSTVLLAVPSYQMFEQSVVKIYLRIHHCFE